jgi:hypothetical protein
MVIFMRVYYQVKLNMDLEFISLLMVIFMREIGKMMNNRDMGF